MDKKITYNDCEEILHEFKEKCSRSCHKNGECIKFVQLYLDNMVCRDKEAYFLEGIKNCPKCTEFYQINECIKNNLKNKCKELSVSDDFITQLKSNLQKENYYVPAK
jgi:hypothetical protein